jgi:NAD(P)-dependent dehydrogenase (short-subunit alcohol dehydrogenase family)
VAFVVGASSGIGLATARRLAAAGCHTALFARREPMLESARAEVAGQAADDARVIARRLDATDLAATRDAFGAACSALGPPDAVLCFAGRAVPRRFAEIDVAQLDDTLRLSLHTSWNVAQAGAELMRGRGGTIVCTSSLAGLIGVFGYTDYCAAKFAVIGLCEALRQELRPEGIGVAVLCPPDTDTPGFAEENRTKPAETRAVSEGASLLRADDVADALLAGLARGRTRIVPGREARWIAWAARHLPALAERVQARQIARASRADTG